MLGPYFGGFLSCILWILSWLALFLIIIFLLIVVTHVHITVSHSSRFQKKNDDYRDIIHWKSQLPCQFVSFSIIGNILADAKCRSTKSHSEGLTIKYMVVQPKTLKENVIINQYFDDSILFNHIWLAIFLEVKSCGSVLFSFDTFLGIVTVMSVCKHPGNTGWSWDGTN